MLKFSDHGASRIDMQARVLLRFAVFYESIELHLGEEMNGEWPLPMRLNVS